MHKRALCKPVYIDIMFVVDSYNKKLYMALVAGNSRKEVREVFRSVPAHGRGGPSSQRSAAVRVVGWASSDGSSDQNEAPDIRGSPRACFSVASTTTSTQKGQAAMDHEAPATKKPDRMQTDKRGASLVPKEIEQRIQSAVPIDRIVPDPDNRAIDEADDAFVALVESVRLFGVLQRIHVRAEGDTYQLIDGERRWRAAKRAGLSVVPCEVWSASASRADILAAGIVLNDQRQAHSCVHIARRLRDIKNADGLSMEQLAERMALSLDRVKTYGGLFAASDFLLQFFSDHNIPLWVAAEFVRYEKATNEARSRRLAERYLEAPLTRQQLIQLRKRETDVRGESEERPSSAPRASFGKAIQRAFQKDPRATISELEEAVKALGFRLMALDTAKPGRVD